MSTRGAGQRARAPPVVRPILDFNAAQRAQRRKTLRDNSEPELVLEKMKQWQRRCARMAKPEHGGTQANVFAELAAFLHEAVESYPRAKIAASEDDKYATSEIYERMRAEAEFLLNDYLPSQSANQP